MTNSAYYTLDYYLHNAWPDDSYPYPTLDDYDGKSLDVVSITLPEGYSSGYVTYDYYNNRPSPAYDHLVFFVDCFKNGAIYGYLVSNLLDFSKLVYVVTLAVPHSICHHYTYTYKYIINYVDNYAFYKIIISQLDLDRVPHYIETDIKYVNSRDDTLVDGYFRHFIENMPCEPFIIPTNCCLLYELEPKKYKKI